MAEWTCVLPPLNFPQSHDRAILKEIRHVMAAFENQAELSSVWTHQMIGHFLLLSPELLPHNHVLYKRLRFRASQRLDKNRAISGRTMIENYAFLNNVLQCLRYWLYVTALHKLVVHINDSVHEKQDILRTNLHLIFRSLDLWIHQTRVLTVRDVHGDQTMMRDQNIPTAREMMRYVRNGIIDLWSKEYQAQKPFPQFCQTCKERIAICKDGIQHVQDDSPIALLVMHNAFLNVVEGLHSDHKHKAKEGRKPVRPALASHPSASISGAHQEPTSLLQEGRSRASSMASAISPSIISNATAKSLSGPMKALMRPVKNAVPSGIDRIKDGRKSSSEST